MDESPKCLGKLLGKDKCNNCSLINLCYKQFNIKSKDKEKIKINYRKLNPLSHLVCTKCG